ncbi:PREDICTED: Krueppel-like factor 17 [Chrysochloris asiatica]|uniref:Krueppel-like factor 17 n=1 Tax=Chrysochloris asiatica TaxID=185453 RepID=A0A9B0TAC5_CHRAS|nr:PREDICTED: Krueppel-like factor 17 [Chrysochloris asiatica]
MEQEAKKLSQWQKAMQDQPEVVTNQSMSLSPGSSGMYNSWNHGPPGIQHFPQSTERTRTPLVSTEGPRQNAGEARSQFNMSMPEHSVNYRPQEALMLSQMIYYQGVSFSQSESMASSGSQMMPSGEPNVPRVPLTFSGNPRMPFNRPPVSTPNANPMSNIRAPSIPYSGPPTIPSNTASLTNTMLLAPSISSTGTQTKYPSLTEMLPPGNPLSLGMCPSVSSPLLDLGSQGSLMNHPDTQEDPFLPEQPLPAPQRPEQDSRSQEEVPRGRPPVLRPYICHFENCGKTYTKRSHLVSHQRKHTGERPYSCNWEGCHWTFARSDELGRHMRIHTRYRPHKCVQCGRQFMRSDHLKQHQRTHIRLPESPEPQTNNEQMEMDGSPVPNL